MRCGVTDLGSASRRVVGLAALCATVALSSTRAAADEPWKHVARKHGMELERRKLAGTSFPELRISAHSPLPVTTIAAAAWADRFDGRLTKKSRILREVVWESGDERVQYNQVRVPVVTNRDYTLRLRRHWEPSGVFHLEIESVEGRPPQKGFVRIPVARGQWTITPTADGGCDVVYVTYAEPGGGVPAFVVKGAQLESAMEVVEEVLDWANRHPIVATAR